MSQDKVLERKVLAGTTAINQDAKQHQEEAQHRRESNQGRARQGLHDLDRLLPNFTLYIKSMTLAASPYPGANDPDHDFASFPEVVTSARSAYAEAGIEEPGQRLGLAEVHDCFTPTELVLMEDLGFSGRGRAWKDVLDGHFDFGGPFARELRWWLEVIWTPRWRVESSNAL